MSKKQSNNGMFTSPSGYFTKVSNQILRDSSLSLRAKGLFSLIASYITLPNFTLYKNYIKSQCSEGDYAFNSAWKELQTAGYLTHLRVRNKSGTFSYEYKLSIPQIMEKENIENPNKFYIDTIDKKNNLDETHFDNPVINKPILENQTPVYYIYNKTLNNKTQSVRGTNRKKIKEQIDYNYFQDEKSFEIEHRTMVDLIVECLEKNKGILTQEQLDSVSSCTILEFFSHVQIKNIKQVKNPKAYWTVVFSNYIKEIQYVKMLL